MNIFIWNNISLYYSPSFLTLSGCIFLALLPLLFAMPRITEKIALPINGIGCRHFLTVHKYGSNFADAGRIYIQASLHADELPGMLVSHHLIKMLDAADKRGEIQKEIIIVPYANPIGLSQILLGSHLGRFNIESGINFNREWIDVTNRVGKSIEGKLKTDDEAHNVRLIREALVAEVDKETSMTMEKVMKRTLFKIACTADIVLDLHCDTGKSRGLPLLPIAVSMQTIYDSSIKVNYRIT